MNARCSRVRGFERIVIDPSRHRQGEGDHEGAQQNCIVENLSEVLAGEKKILRLPEMSADASLPNMAKSWPASATMSQTGDKLVALKGYSFHQLEAFVRVSGMALKKN